MKVLPDKRFWLGAGTVVVLGVAIPLIVIASGMINLSAMSGQGPERVIGPWALNASRRHHASDLKNPFANDLSALDIGLDHYRENCLVCHGSPDTPAGELAQGLNPPAPHLTTQRIEKLSDGELFWTIKNGIKMTGMPAFAPTHTDDEIWQCVTAIRHLGDLTPAQSAKLAATKPQSEHHHDEGKKGEKPDLHADANHESSPSDVRADKITTDEHTHMPRADDVRPPEASGEKTAPSEQNPLPPGEPGKDYIPVIVPNGTTLPWKVVDGVKVFHLTAEAFKHEVAPGLVITAYGYNGQTPGPVIEVVEGDSVRFYVTNHLPEKTSIHWHGILLPNGMDGVSGLNQEGIKPGETYKYEFTIRQHGTNMYHPHFDEMTQISMGMMGMFVMHERKPHGPKIDRDFAYMLNEWAITAGTARPNPNEMSAFNILTFNGKSSPGTAPLVAKTGDRVRVRLGNLGPMDHHPIHLHGYQFKLTGTDGGDIDPAAQWPETTALVPVGSTRAFEFVADAPGDWALHCHMTHHVMNQMGHGLPNLLGIDPKGLDAQMQRLLPNYMTMGAHGMGAMGEMGMQVPENSIPMQGAEGPYGYIDMGGMFTVLKVRDQLTSYDDPGWYRQPVGTSARAASPDELLHDGIDANAPAKVGVPEREIEPPTVPPSSSGHHHGQ